jgi:hypothetical protein
MNISTLLAASPNATEAFENFKPRRATSALLAEGLITADQEEEAFNDLGDILEGQMPVAAVPLESAAAAASVVRVACAGAVLGGPGPSAEQLEDYAKVFV